MTATWTVLADGRGSGRPSADRPVSMRRVVLQIVAAAVVAVAVVGFAGSLISRHLAEQQSVNDAARTTDLLAESVVQPALTDALVGNSAAAGKVLDPVVRARVLSSSLVRVKIWQPDGGILYSDDARLVGQRFALDDEARDALTTPRTNAGVSDLRRPENRFERSQGKLLEVYRPVWTPNGSPLLLETYFKYGVVNEHSAQLWRGFVGVMLSSLAAVLLLVLPLIWMLFERTRRAQEQRAVLMGHALDASRDERARIAATLHDGVVQQLAAASFATAGEAERAGAAGDAELATRLHDTAATMRASIAGVRSLLVDIYPPSLRASGLSAALRDLASTAGAGTVAVHLDVDAAAADALPADLQEAVYRVAQEALRNAVAHSGAREVTLSLARVDATVRLDVADDGSG
ncbi:MAG TPA: histidine kinase, partial [Jatrophihabitantaceae bacterium]|nr:histidine kinase [Jatrophihabitantaceae bacterium]